MSFLGSGNPHIFPKSNTPQTVAGRKRPEELPALVGIEYQKEFFVIMGNRRFFAYKECGMDLDFKMILHSEDYTTLENQEEREAFKFKVEFPGAGGNSRMGVDTRVRQEMSLSKTFWQLRNKHSQAV